MVFGNEYYYKKDEGEYGTLNKQMIYRRKAYGDQRGIFVISKNKSNS